MEIRFIDKDQSVYSFSFTNKTNNIYWVYVSKDGHTKGCTTYGTRVINFNEFEWGSSDWISLEAKLFIEKVFRLKAFL